MLAGLLAASFCGVAQAQWKWRDKGGQIHLSDLPPPSEVPDKDVMQRPASASHRSAPAPGPIPSEAASAAAARPNAIDPELEARMRRAEVEKQAQKKAEDEKQAAARAENCKRARDYLRNLDSGMRISRTNDRGEREFIDDKQRADEVNRTRDVITSDCR
jgi:hypothetical protein